MKLTDKLASSRRGLTTLQKTLPFSEDLRRGLKVFAWVNWISGVAAAGLVFTLCHIVSAILA